MVRTTFLKWVLMLFTAGKYAIMGIFPSKFLDCHAPSPPQLRPTLLTLFFSLTEACLSGFPQATSVLASTQMSRLTSCCHLCLCARNI